MAATVVLMMTLAAALRQSTGLRPSLASLSTQNAGQQQEITERHNDLRRSVNPSARNMLRMEWNPTAAENARRWAQQCTLNHSPREKRTIDGKVCGENLFMSTAPTSWSEAIQAWFDEVKYFKYGYGSVTGEETGHYTQVVWYRSYQLGCAIAHCPWSKFAYYYVCHYCPGGNIVGSISTPYKTGRPCEDCPNACDNKLCTNPCKHNNIYSNCPDLARSHGCDHPDVKEWCKASCQCKTEII
ncbi:PREDICTED: cysteine-rich venom protein pseudechetoxin-like [Gekko japonicus]|uniref:Cysteine-rich venom protein pseudechetoxin-like n=1 Tax=Gekko japonicus TaxID=146911 RepID=A0ABM1KWG1_GEKJA|nr:PREDICTED: cysteine-rich venom protein pseudechetoxin-like [Gekko japonicus]